MRIKPHTEEDRAAVVAPAIVPSMPWRVRSVEARENYILVVSFLDGTTGDVEMRALIEGGNAGVFAALRDAALFRQARIRHGSVTWPNDLDLAPDAMYAAIKASGRWVLQ